MRTRSRKVFASMSRENWIRIAPLRSASVSPAVGVEKTTCGGGCGGGGGIVTSTGASVGAVAACTEVASIHASGPSRRTVPATCSQRPLSIRELTSRSKPRPRGRIPVTQIAASADCSTKSQRPLVPAPIGRSANRLLPRKRPVTVTPLPTYCSGASASARIDGSGGSGDSTALAFSSMNTCSRAGHWPFEAASSSGWKLTLEKRESVRSSRPTSKTSPRTSVSCAMLAGSRQKTKIGFEVPARRISVPAASTSRRTTTCLPWKKTGAATSASAVVATLPALGCGGADTAPKVLVLTGLEGQSTASTPSTRSTRSTFCTFSTSAPLAPWHRQCAAPLRELLLRRAREDNPQRREQQPARDHAERAFVQRRDQAQRPRVVGRLDNLPPEEHRVEDSCQRSAGDQPRAEQGARADFGFLGHAGLALHEPAYQTAGEDGGGRGNRQVRADRERQRMDAAQLERDRDEHADEHQAPRQVLAEQSLDDGRHQRRLRRRQRAGPDHHHAVQVERRHADHQRRRDDADEQADLLVDRRGADDVAGLEVL